MTDTSVLRGKKARAGIKSEERRRQGRVASKNYREKRKQKLQLLESIVATYPAVGHEISRIDAANSARGQIGGSQGAGTRSRDSVEEIDSSALPVSGEAVQHVETNKGVGSHALNLQDPHRQPFSAKSISRCFWALKRDQRRRLFALIRDNGLRYLDILTLLQDPLLDGRGAPNINLLQDLNLQSKLPDLRMNNFPILQASFFAAIYANARALGFDFEDYLDDDDVSPLVEGNDPTKLGTSLARYASIPQALRPVEAQITQEHHPYLDVIPFPEFRARLLSAISVSPPLIDEAELCIDLTDDGLVCWGSCNSDGVRSAARVPWDARSWEPKPWFLRKYWFLVGEKDGEMWSASRWWSEIRGDSLDD
ncbi:hypothetical protein NA57DRAFT_79414 [Rhizodiscina lignyota]|uniref:BZIP domain-containing protein n=1 Tax=Rhizodiscina lignyota TaxID=1504668 RepID=A0A9P4IBV2_9PEZI|nr:hypothetical protein NA57DRAFT_79414 [Rhizodiscina lignyota]